MSMWGGEGTWTVTGGMGVPPSAFVRDLRGRIVGLVPTLKNGYSHEDTLGALDAPQYVAIGGVYGECISGQAVLFASLPRE